MIEFLVFIYTALCIAFWIILIKAQRKQAEIAVTINEQVDYVHNKVEILSSRMTECESKAKVKVMPLTSDTIRLFELTSDLSRRIEGLSATITSALVRVCRLEHEIIKVPEHTTDLSLRIDKLEKHIANNSEFLSELSEICTLSFSALEKRATDIELRNHVLDSNPSYTLKGAGDVTYSGDRDEITVTNSPNYLGGGMPASAVSNFSEEPSLDGVATPTDNTSGYMLYGFKSVATINNVKWDVDKVLGNDFLLKRVDQDGVAHFMTVPRYSCPISMESI